MCVLLFLKMCKEIVMLPVDVARVGEAYQDLQVVEPYLDSYATSFKAVIPKLEAKMKDTKVAAAEKKLIGEKRLPTAKTAQRDVLAAIPELKNLFDVELPKRKEYASAEDFMKLVGARVLVMLSQAYSSMEACEKTMMIQPKQWYMEKEEGRVRTLFLTLGEFQTRLSKASVLSGALRAAPAKPAAAAPAAPPPGRPVKAVVAAAAAAPAAKPSALPNAVRAPKGAPPSYQDATKGGKGPAKK